MTEVRNVRYTDPALVTKGRISAAPRSGQTVSGYGGKIPTGYMLRYEGRRHRVYMMQYSNSGTPYIRHAGEDLILDIDTCHDLEALTEGGRSTDPQEES